MKKYQNNIFAKALLILIAISFVVVGGISGGLITRSHVATVKGEKISFADFYRSYVYQVRQIGLDPALLRQMQYANIILDGMIRDMTTYVYAKDVGIIATDASLAEQIRQTPAFQLNGIFDEQQYTAVLQSNGISSDSYLDNLKKSTTTNKYLDAFQVFGLKIPTSVDILYKNSQQSRNLITAKKDFADVTDPTITDTDLNTYYTNNQQDFEVPETRTVTALYLDNTSVANSISDADAKIYFDDNPGVFDTPESRSYYTIGGNKDTLNAVIDALKSGTDIRSAIKDVLDQEADTLFTENAVKDTIDTSLQEAVFNTDVGAYSDIIEGPFSNLFVYVEAVNPEKIVTFADVSSEVKQTLAFERIFDKTVEIEDNIANGKSLTDIGKIIGIPAVTVDVTKTGSGAHPFASNSIFIDTVFNMTEGNVSDVKDLENETFVVVRLDKVELAYVPELTDIKDNVTQKFIAQSKTDTLNKELEQLVKLTDEEAFSAQAEKMGYKITPLVDQKASEVNDASLAEAFNIKIGTALSDIDNDMATAIFAVSRKVPNDIPEEQQQQFDNTVKTSTNESIISSIQSDLVQQIPAKIDRKMVDSVYSAGGFGY